MSYKVSDTAEVWKSVKGFEGLYEVSNLGRIRSMKADKPIILKQCFYRKGYRGATLYKGGKQAQVKTHRLVAEAFIPNPNNFPQINHKDENPSNNRVENLEWCTPKYNTNYGGHRERLSRALTNHPQKSKQVEQYDLTGTLVATYPSVSEAARTLGKTRQSIDRCCRGGLNKTHGFIWKYKK